MTHRVRYMLLGVIPIVVLIDQISKYLVLSRPEFRALDCLDQSIACGRIDVSPFFDLSMVWNRGVSFGTLQSEGAMRWVLVALTLAIAIGFTIWLLSAERKLTFAGLLLVVGGALGNLIDRVRFGAVVDFLDFSEIYFVWVFNVADTAISVGAALLFIDQFLMSGNQSAEKSD